MKWSLVVLSNGYIESNIIGAIITFLKKKKGTSCLVLVTLIFHFSMLEYLAVLNDST